MQAVTVAINIIVFGNNKISAKYIIFWRDF